MAKLLILRRGTTTQHGSFTGAEGEVTVDTDKETLVVHDGSTAGGHPVAAEDMANVSSASIAGRLSNDSIAVGKIAAGTLPSDVKIADANVSGNLTIESADLVDGTIVNADINASAAIGLSKLETGALPSGITVASANIVDGTITNGDVNTGAAIAGTKVNPDFGSQSLVTTGNILLNGDSTGASNHRLTLGAASGGDLAIYHDGTNSYLDNSGGILYIRDTSGGDVRIQGKSGEDSIICHDDDGVHIYYDNAVKLTTESYGVNVTGNINVSGTVDGRDVATDGTKLDGIETAATADQTGSEILSLINSSDIYTSSKIGRDAGDYITFTTDTQMDVYVNGNNEFRFEADGDFHADGDVIAQSTTISSDAKLKEDIELVPDALGKLNKLNGVTFKWKRSNEKSAGVIAQDVQKVLPEAVKEVTAVSNGETHLSVNYHALTSILIEAVKELQAEVEKLKGGK